MSYAVGICHDQVHVQEARIAAIEHAQAIAPRLNVYHRPRLAVHADGVAKELRNPELVGAPVGHRIKERAVRIEQPVLYDQRDFELPLGKVQRIFHRVTDQVRAGQPLDHIQARDSQRVVVIPEHGGLLVIGIDKSVWVVQHRAGHAIGRNPCFRIAIAFRQDLGAVQVDYVAYLRLVGFRSMDGEIYRQRMRRG